MRAAGALVLLALAALALEGAPAAAAEKAARPPLNIAADNVTGSHEAEGDIVMLHGHVKITRERTIITADNGRYLRALGMLYLEGRVRMVDSTATVTCDRAAYAESTDVLDLTGNVVVNDKNGTLRAPAGTYDRRSGRAVLTGGVTGKDGDQRLSCDRAVYLRDSSRVQARGNVHGFDDKNQIELDAQAIDYDRARHVAVATQNPVMRATDHNGKTVEMRAVQLRLNTETRVAEAIDSVRVVQDTLQASADHALFDDLKDHGWMTGSPRLSDGETNVTGDSIEVLTDRRVLKRVIVRGKAAMDYHGLRAGTIGESSKLTGQRVEVFLTRDAIDSLVAIGGARNEYQAVPRPGQTSERNLADGDTITVFFRERKIDRARVEGRAEGEYRLGVAEKDTIAARKERVNYDARRIEFVVPKSRIVLDQDAHLTYQDLELRSRRVEFDVDRQTLVAEGNPQLLDRGDKVTGWMMTYDLESRVGNIYDAQTTYERGLYHGEQIRKAADNELDVLNGVYSTCDLPEPHYHFKSHWMKIYLKDKMVAKPVVFYIENVPMLALPFWVFPIRPGRHSGFLFPQFELGLNNKSGQFIRNAGYYWALNDYMDFTATGDYYQALPSWRLHGESYYKLLYAFEGSVMGDYVRDEAARTTNWDFRADHSQDLSPRTRLAARAEFVSNSAFSQSASYGNTLDERLNRFLTSNVSISHNADWASLNMAVDRREDIDADRSLIDPDGPGPLHGPPAGTLASLNNLTQSEPSFSLSLPTRTLGTFGPLRGTPFEKALSSVYLSFSSRFLSERDRQAFVLQNSPGVGAPDTILIGQNVTVRRAYSASSFLSDSRRLFGWLNFAPRVAANMVLWDYDLLGNKTVPSATWNAGASMSSSFYGSFHPHLGPLTGLRHVLVPSVGVTYSPEFSGLTFTDASGIQRNRFQPFDGMSISGFKSANLSFGLDQRLQAKLKHGDQIQRLDNLLSMFSSASYNLLWREQGQIHPLSPISSSLLLQPPGVVNLSVGWVTDPYQGRPLRSLTYNANLTLSSAGPTEAVPDLPVDRTARGVSTVPQVTWSLGVAYSYGGGYSGPQWASQQTANLVARSQLTPSWGVEYSTSYDVTLHEVGTQNFALTRDLHCWTAYFSRSFTLGGEAEYFFRMSVKDQRELFLEKGTRNSNLGGIQ